MILRPYQQRAVDAVMLYFERNHGNPLVALPTGTGKSLVIAEIIRLAMQYEGQRILMMVHSKELIKQDHDEAVALIPGLDAGILSAGLDRFDTSHAVLFAGIQTLHRRAEQVGKIDLAIVDEAHCFSDNEASMYQKTLATLRSTNPLLKVIGLTATPYRSKSGLLTDGKLFDAVVCDQTTPTAFRQFIADGYLAPLVPKAARTEIDLSNVRTVAGDYAQGQLETVMLDNTEQAVKEILTQGTDRKRWLIFCAGIAHSEKVNNALCAAGIDSRVVHSKQEQTERDSHIADFRAGRCRAICNTGILTTGFNCPDIDLVAILRPTQSPGLFVQMLGRGTRPAPGKVNCLVLDFGRNTERLGPIDNVKIPRKSSDKKMKYEPQAKICINCWCWIPPACRTCPHCGYVEPASEVEHTPQASTRSLLSEYKAPEWVVVDDVTYSVHKSKSGRDTLRVMYHCGLKMYSEYVCVGYMGFPGEKARRWLLDRIGSVQETPEKCLEASKNFAKPKKILIDSNGKFPDIKQVEWRQE